MTVPKTSARVAQWRAQAHRQWEALPLRQRVLASVAGGLLLAAIAWWLALAPALVTLRTASAQHQALDAQLQRMRALQAQARSLQTMPRMGREDALRALETSVRQQLGAGARLQPTGDTASLTLTGVRADALAAWIAQARADAKVLPGEARLTRNAQGLWDGTLVLTLPTP